VAVAQKRRNLPPGGQLKEDYVFQWANDGKVGKSVKFSGNHVDTVWPYWNLMDFTPEGRPDIPTPPQKFRSEFLEKHYLNKE
jgi:predicted dithiol-disulfide oxidoreductase (DUF899 family)